MQRTFQESERTFQESEIKVNLWKLTKNKKKET